MLKDPVFTGVFFFGGMFPSTGSGNEFFLVKEYRAMEGGLAACGDLFVRIAASSAAMTACVVVVLFF